ncbi:MAG: hypothetical protein O2895_04235, partial [Chloroflexi bacterium]|nr:hypothetical protein [Chloroflexota bacterium]
SGRWVTSLTFPERGTWYSGPEIGLFLEVFDAELGLVERGRDLPLSAAPKTVAVLDGAATEVLRTFAAEQGGIGLLSDPDRVVFVQSRDGARWLVTGDVATGEVAPLFEVGPFANVVAAPDGRAVAVEWGRPATGVRELRIVTAAGDVNAVEDGAISHITLAWAPDSSTLVAAGDSLWILDPDGGVREEFVLSGKYDQLFWSPKSDFVLLRSGARIDRYYVEDRLLTGDLLQSFPMSISHIAISPAARLIALLWFDEIESSTHVSVMPTTRLVGTRIEDEVVATLEQSEDRYFTGGALSWSSDGRLLTLGGLGLALDGSAPGPGSQLAVLDPETGDLRVVARAPDFYALYDRGPYWSADGSTLFAERFNCDACEPSSSSVDVIDVARSEVVASFEGAGFLGMTAGGTAALVSAPDGLLRVDAQARAELLVPFAGGISFGPGAVGLTGRDGDSLIAVQLGLGSGNQIFAARPDGSEVTALGVLDLEEGPHALLDAATAVVRTPDALGWERRGLRDGTSARYLGSSNSPEKFAFALSPSGTLALDMDHEGFAVLDATDPAAAAILPRRSYPSGTFPLYAWSPDEREVAVADDRVISIVDVATGDDRVFELDPIARDVHRDQPFQGLWAITWTPAGAVEYAATSGLWRLDVDAGAAAQVAEGPRPGGFTQGTVLAYSPDGQTLAAATQFGIFVLGEEGAWRELSQLGIGIGSGSGALHWAPDSSAVVFVAQAAHVPEGVIVAPLDGSGAYRLVAAGAVRLLDWLADGRIVWASVTGGV